MIYNYSITFLDKRVANSTEIVYDYGRKMQKWWNGRHAILRGSGRMLVWVQVPSSAPLKITGLLAGPFYYIYTKSSIFPINRIRYCFYTFNIPRKFLDAFDKEHFHKLLDLFPILLQKISLLDNYNILYYIFVLLSLMKYFQD